MPNPISRFVRFIVASRLAQLLFLVHLVLVAYAVHRMPLANPDSWGSGGGCHGIPIADRVLFYCDTTGLLRIIATLDFIAVVLFGTFATLFAWLPTGGFHIFSWTVALVVLIVVSLQWMLIGACVERLVRRFTRNGGV
jgi:hypothetical protein